MQKLRAFFGILAVAGLVAFNGSNAQEPAPPEAIKGVVRLDGLGRDSRRKGSRPRGTQG